MEDVEDIVIVGAGISGLATALGLHRQGIRSIVLESYDEMRITGFALTIWTNAWKALDALGIGHSLREQHIQLNRNVAKSTITGLPTSEMSFKTKGTIGDHEVYCLKRKSLMETLANELPDGTIKYSSKVVNIEESGYFKLLHLADGSILKAKVLIGCDGVNSIVAKYLGFNKASATGRYAIRGYADFKCSDYTEPTFLQFFGEGVRSGFIPCDDDGIFYWFFTCSPANEKVQEENGAKLKQYVLSKMGKVPDMVRNVITNTNDDDCLASPLRYRHPWELLWANISKGNVCVAGDALHPMTPDIGQGGCSALEDGVTLARCLGEAIKGGAKDEEESYSKRIENGLRKYGKERRWRSFHLIATAYMVGFMQQCDGKVMIFFRDKILSRFLASLPLKKADFDCGKLPIS